VRRNSRAEERAQPIKNPPSQDLELLNETIFLEKRRARNGEACSKGSLFNGRERTEDGEKG